jgi:predicted dehydrogenase
MRALRCGVAGLRRGRLFVEIFDGLPDCQIVAVCDINPKALADFSNLATHTDFGAFLGEGLDVVAVVTPGPAHAEQSVRALEAGGHVLCETPCVYSLDEAAAVVDAVRRTGRKYMLAEDYIWTGWARALKAKAEAGAFGKIVYAEGDYTHDCRDLMLATEDGFVPYARRQQYPRATRTWRATHLPPILYCSHTLGPLLHVMEDRVVSAVGFSTGTHTAPDLGTIDVEAGLFQTAKGAVIRLTNGFSVACPMSLYYSLVGTAGSARIDTTGGFSAHWYSTAVEPAMKDWSELPAAVGSDCGEVRGGHVAVMVRQFIQSILNDTPPPLDVYRSMEMVLPGILAHESAGQGGIKLRVPELRSRT